MLLCYTKPLSIVNPLYTCVNGASKVPQDVAVTVSEGFATEPKFALATFVVLVSWFVICMVV
jgi:hypothetical protein